MDLEYVEFQKVDLSDIFFDSLKQDYEEFETWFTKKATNKAYVFRNPAGKLEGFLYLKREVDALDDVQPMLSAKNRLKVGTFKIDAHGTKLGERFIKKIFDHAIFERSEEIYVTVFEKHEGLISLLTRYGFRRHGEKTTSNGTELVLLRKMEWQEENSLDANYPLVNLRSKRQFLLALYPEWHTRLLPDSILKTEDSDIIRDVSHANSVHKVYLTAMRGVRDLKKGDALLIYRTSDNQGPALYRSVVTSVCVVEEVKDISSFITVEEFLQYCSPFSVFDEDELRGYYQSKKYPIIINFTYNVALPKRLTRKLLIEDIGLDAKERWGIMPIKDTQFKQIIQKSQVHENLIIY